MAARSHALGRRGESAARTQQTPPRGASGPSSGGHPVFPLETRSGGCAHAARGLQSSRPSGGFTVQRSSWAEQLVSAHLDSRCRSVCWPRGDRAEKKKKKEEDRKWWWPGDSRRYGRKVGQSFLVLWIEGSISSKGRIPLFRQPPCLVPTVHVCAKLPRSRLVLLLRLGALRHAAVSKLVGTAQLPFVYHLLLLPLA